MPERFVCTLVRKGAILVLFLSFPLLHRNRRPQRTGSAPAESLSVNFDCRSPGPTTLKLMDPGVQHNSDQSLLLNVLWDYWTRLGLALGSNHRAARGAAAISTAAMVRVRVSVRVRLGLAFSG